MTLLKENINAHHPECLKMYLLIIMCRFLNYSNSFSFWNCWTINSHRHGERIVLGITSYYLKASSLCNEDCAPYLVSPQYEWGMMKAPCLWDAVYIIRGSYLTYLGPCIRPEISDCVCVCESRARKPPFFIKYVCYTALTPSWSLPSGVFAGGWAPAPAGLTPRGSSQTYRHAAAAIQSPAGEATVCQDERSSDLHSGMVQSFSLSQPFVSNYFISVFCFRVWHERRTLWSLDINKTTVCFSGKIHHKITFYCLCFLEDGLQLVTLNCP